MKLHRILIWILQGILLLVVGFFGLIALDYYFMLDWLTDMDAFLILTLVLLCHFLAGLIRLKKSLHDKGHYEIDNHESYPRKATKEYPKDYTDYYNKRKRQPRRAKFKPAIAIMLVAVAIVGFGAYNFINNRSMENVPENVIEFGEKYPEASEYVRNFNKYVDKDFDMDVTKEMFENDIPLFIQWDKRWGYKDYGGNYVGVAGCGPTCIAMIACGLEQNPDINPYEVANYAASQGYYTYGQGTSWTIMTDGAKHFGLNVTNGNVSADYILQNLSNDTPMICSMSPGDFTTSGHFIVLTGIDSDGEIIVNDPNSPKNSKKHWDVNTLVSQMKSVWKYSRKRC